MDPKQARWQPEASYCWWPSGQRFWVCPADFEKEFGRPYPAAQPGVGEPPDVERGCEAVNNSL